MNDPSTPSAVQTDIVVDNGRKAKHTQTSLDNMRRVQQTGRSSLTVSLPHWWVEKMGVRPGDVILLQPASGNRLELSLTSHGASATRSQDALVIMADEAPAGLLSRLITGAYITGHDQIVIRTQQGLDQARSDEIARTAARLLGTGIVEEGPNETTIQVFADPSRHHFAALLDRIVTMLKLEVGYCRDALRSGSSSCLARMDLTEEEIDRAYFLMVRQILLAADDFQMADDVGIVSHRIQIGSRMVAKGLEIIGDKLNDTGKVLADALHGKGPPVLALATSMELAEEFEEFEGLLGQTLQGFKQVSPETAHAALTSLKERIETLMNRRQKMNRHASNVSVIASTQRIASNLLTAMEMLVIINELTINRSTEPELFAEHHRMMMVIHSIGGEELPAPVPALDLTAASARPHPIRSSR